MKNLVTQLTLLYFIIFLNTNLIAQNGWHWQHPDPQGNTLQSVSYCDEYYGFAVGNLGVIIYTSNGGTNWNTQISGTSETLNDVCAINPSRAVIAGNNGIILQTADGGQNWYMQPSGTTEDLFAVSFTDENTGTVVGAQGTIMHTTDGGQNWNIQNCGTTNWLFGVSFSDANTGTIVGTYGSIYRTTDGGQNWIAQQSGTTGTLSGVSFCNDDFGFAIGTAGTLLHTANGGDNWSPITITSKNLYDVSVIDPDHCTIVGKDKTVILITDNGNSWTSYYQVGSNNFYGAYGGTIVGTGGQIFKTIDNGETWTKQKSGPEYMLEAVSFSDVNNGTAIGDRGTILHTSDGGSSWELQEYDSPSTNGSINDMLSDVCFTSNTRGYVVSGQNYIPPVGFFYNGLILRTVNGGANWTALYSTTYRNYYGVSFVDDNKGIAVGLYRKWGTNEYEFYSAFSKTLNGGDTWTHLHFTTINDRLTDVEFITSERIIFVGESGRILRSDNGTESFSTISSSTTVDLNGVSFSDSTHGTIVGNNGTILRTIDGGISWVDQTSGTSEDLFDVSFIDNDNGMIVGDNGLVLRTIDGGDNWFEQTAGSYYDLRGAFLAGVNEGYVVGNYGNIFKNDNAAAMSTFENISICEGESYLGWSASGAYDRTLTSSIGADSIMTTFLVINPIPGKPGISLEQDTLISTSLYGNQWYLDGMAIIGATDQKMNVSQEGEYSVVVSNSAGCISESSEVINYTTTSCTPTDTTLTETACDWFSLNGNVLIASGTYSDTLVNAEGCDSIITINLIILERTTASVDVTACESYTAPSSNYTWTSNGTYTDTIQNVSGCDSIITINLTIETIDNSLTQSGTTLTANTIGAGYQWLDCDDGLSVINGETGRSYTAEASGNYAVEITQNTCVDTSACLAITVTGILENSFGSGFVLYPNPTSGKLFVELGSIFDNIHIEISNNAGEIIEIREMKSINQLTIELTGPVGMYYILLQNNSGERVLIKVVKE